MKTVFRAGLSLVLGIGAGAGVAALFPDVNFWMSWLGSSLLFCLAFYFLISAWKWLGNGKAVGWMIFIAFGLRLIVGIGSSLALPEWGWDEPAQNAGYLFFDAYRRDAQAWDLAQSGESILYQTRDELYTDQYGGMLAISAMVYRTLSPDAHRPFLLLILGAFAFAIGIPFFYQAVNQRWGKRLALLAAWLLVLYPDGILYTSSQMREPFLLGLSMIAFWSIMNWSARKRWVVLLFFVSMALMTVISSRITVAIFIFLLVVFLLERMEHLPKSMHNFTWVVLALLFVALVGVSWAWLKSSAEWDMLLTERGSGWVTKVITEIGSQYRIPFLVIYGIAQPVLPATIAEPTLPFWKVINIFRASGWYMLAPLLIYAVFSLFKGKHASERRIFAWLVVFSLLWIVISSARAGGDFWDNPRYRMNMLPWLVMVAAWAVLQAIKYRDAWLPRWLLIEAVFLGFFTNWYFSRYFLTWRRLPFTRMIAWIIGISAGIIILGLIFDLVIKPILMKRTRFRSWFTRDIEQ